MSKDEIAASDRRGATSQVISHMLTERNQLLALLIQCSAVKNENMADLERGLLNEFCQILVDYIASGHFGLYERIVEGTERRRGVAELAVQLYPLIDETTQIALAFNEKYDPQLESLDVSNLHQDLSTLGEQLTNRIEYEDQIIQKLSEPK